jgi:hypothetical protein
MAILAYDTPSAPARCHQRQLTIKFKDGQAVIGPHLPFGIQYDHDVEGASARRISQRSIACGSALQRGWFNQNRRHGCSNNAASDTHRTPPKIFHVTPRMTSFEWSAYSHAKPSTAASLHSASPNIS